jgi:hypothetical protein
MGFGEGIAVTDLFQLLNSIKSKSGLQLDVKILDKPWEPIGPMVIKEMILAINTGKIQGGGDIRLRLHEKEKSSS